MVEQAVAPGVDRRVGRMSQNKLTDKYLAAFQASGLKASEFHAAVQPAVVGTNMEGRCLTRPGRSPTKTGRVRVGTPQLTLDRSGAWWSRNRSACDAEGGPQDR